jgi:hypothetical protein
VATVVVGFVREKHLKVFHESFSSFRDVPLIVLQVGELLHGLFILDCK